MERLFGSYVAALEVFAVHIGVEHGLYALLAARPATSEEVASAAGLHERYVREWLEQQAVAGLISVDDPAADPQRRRYSLPAAHYGVLVDPADPAHLASGAGLVTAIGQVMSRVVEAFRTGVGVPFADYGAGLAHGIALFNGPSYRAELGSVWLPSVPAVEAMLRRRGARVLDVGCGYGVSSIEIARAYPQASVVGLDLDAASIARAREAASTAGVADRVSFTVGDAAGLDSEAEFDLVTIFEALHDMGDPVGALRAARAALRPGGLVLVADERVAETFTAPGDEIERFCYVASVVHCLPATMAEDPVEANGTVLRPATVLRWAKQAGFEQVNELPIESAFWRFYLLTP